MANTGVNQVDTAQGVWSPTENRWISNAEIQNFFAANPNMSATEMNRLAGNLGMNPYAINYAANVGTGSKGPRDPAYAQLVHELEASQWRGDSGYGVDNWSSPNASTTALSAGAGNTQYKMPDGSMHSVNVVNGRPVETYQQALNDFNTVKGQTGGTAAAIPTPERQPAETYQPWTRPTQTTAPVVTPGQVSGNPAVTQTPAIAQTPLQPPTNSFPTPVLNALYAAQQQRMLSPAPTFNFQNGMQAQPTGTTGPLTQVAQPPVQGAMPALPPQIQPPPNPYGGVPNSQFPITPPGTGGLEPMPAGTSPGQPGFINGKDDPTMRNPGAGSSQPGGGDVIQGTSLTLPSVWGGMGAAEKIDWFNQNNVSVDAMRQNGVTDSEIAWMKQNGYASGGSGGGSGPNPVDNGYVTTQQPEQQFIEITDGPGGWQTGGSEPNPYVSNGWVASGSGGTKPGVAGNEKHPSASIPTPEARPTPTSWGRNFAQGGALTRAITQR